MRKWMLYSLLGMLFFLVGCQAQTVIVLKPADEDRTYTEAEGNAIHQVLEQRLDALNFAEANISYEFRDEVPYFSLEFVDDAEQASAQIANFMTGVGLLEFVDYAGLAPELLAIISEEGTCIVTTNQVEIGLADIDENGIATSSLCENPFITEDEQPFMTVLSNEGIEKAAASQDAFSGYSISFVLTDNGSEIFERHTATNQGQQLAIVVNGEVISAPVINAVISKNGKITGDFTQEEAQALALQLNSALLTIPLEVVEINESGEKLPW